MPILPRRDRVFRPLEECFPEPGDTSAPMVDFGTDNSIADGYIYLLYASTGAYKIGYTRNLQNRLSQLNGVYGVTVTCIHSFRSRNMPQAERLMHHHYRSQRLESEWFRLTKSDVRDICRLRDYELDE
jgi:hypothetical protein